MRGGIGRTHLGGRLKYSSESRTECDVAIRCEQALGGGGIRVPSLGFCWWLFRLDAGVGEWKRPPVFGPYASSCSRTPGVGHFWVLRLKLHLLSLSQNHVTRQRKLPSMCQLHCALDMNTDITG